MLINSGLIKMEAILGHVLNGLSPHQMWLKDKPPAEEGVARSFGNWHMLIVLTDIHGYFGNIINVSYSPIWI